MHNYKTKMEDGSVEIIEASNPGHAFAKAIKEGKKPVLTMREGEFRDGYGYTKWQCPSLAKVEPLPKEKAEQLTMEL